MHQYIIGATRSGKSNYLMSLARSEEPVLLHRQARHNSQADRGRNAVHLLAARRPERPRLDA
jgi:adenosyl cobinamide kinase/adenosyl cobinamide phosphate guanylyltransferase